MIPQETVSTVVAKNQQRNEKRFESVLSYLGCMFDVENGQFEPQALKRFVRADVREGLGKLLGRGVGGKSLYGIRSRGAESTRYRVQAVRVPG